MTIFFGAVLRWVILSIHGSYKVSKIFVVSELILNRNRPEGLIHHSWRGRALQVLYTKLYVWTPYKNKSFYGWLRSYIAGGRSMAARVNCILPQTFHYFRCEIEAECSNANQPTYSAIHNTAVQSTR